MEFANQIFDWLKWGIGKLTSILLWLAELIGTKAGIETKNVYLILLLAISLYLGSKITEERGLKLLLIAAVIFATFWQFGKI